ncbi:hypothetical protein SMU82_00515 [Streptococcus mutans SM6]|uniref:Uncharacterized protein n=1 Tax=Streptococcus mutans SM6 TaxID=857119 RepID=A0A829BUN5_STRMG|nr:hypothetical protein SMU22_08048 [Streptococcus mutans 4SM1]EMB97639.1 hypothetical protein SMU62_02683 [Streptococcus mutans M21]EMC22442.1 hypothetical protein SMU80_00362 [Streptococcus mutans SF1]EMC25761.1 hypothetical protein SMU82_00515 [Streptococcus mutans SM6]
MRFLKDELSVSVRLQEKSIEALPFRTKIEIESDNQIKTL